MDPFYDSWIFSSASTPEIIDVAGWDGPDLVVTGSVFWNGILIYPNFEAWVNYEEWLSYQQPDVVEGTDAGDDIVVTAPQNPSNPEASIDELSQLIALEIMAELDPTIEYGAIIWRDADGAYHKTRVFPGEAGV